MYERVDRARFLVALKACLGAEILSEGMKFADEEYSVVSQDPSGFGKNE